MELDRVIDDTNNPISIREADVLSEQSVIEVSWGFDNVIEVSLPALILEANGTVCSCLLYTSPSPRDS